MLHRRVHRNDQDVMYRQVEDVVPSLVEVFQERQLISVVQRHDVEGGVREEGFDYCCSL